MECEGDLRAGARAADRAIIGKGKGNKRPSFIYGNNRLEGSAVKPIEATLENTVAE